MRRGSRCAASAEQRYGRRYSKMMMVIIRGQVRHVTASSPGHHVSSPTVYRAPLSGYEHAAASYSGVIEVADLRLWLSRC